MNLKGYLIIICSISILTSLLVSFYYNLSFLYVLGIMWLGIILIIIIDGLTATICRLLPRKYVDFNNKVYLVSKKEKTFYEKIKIKNWKEKIPEIGHFTHFRKNKISEPKNKEYIHRFLIEICYGELGHFISMFTGLLLLLIPFFKPIWLILSLVIITVNAFLNVLPVFVLRYNSFTLLLLYKHLLRIENKGS